MKALCSEKHFKEFSSVKIYYESLMRMFKLNHFGKCEPLTFAIFMYFIFQFQLVMQKLKNIKLISRRA